MRGPRINAGYEDKTPAPAPAPAPAPVSRVKADGQVSKAEGRVVKTGVRVDLITRKSPGMCTLTRVLLDGQVSKAEGRVVKTGVRVDLITRKSPEMCTLTRVLLHRQRDRWVAAMQRTTVPLRLVIGMADPVSGWRIARRYRELLPNADVVELPDIGHYPQVEAPSEVLAALWAFMGRAAHGSVKAV